MSVKVAFCRWQVVHVQRVDRVVAIFVSANVVVSVGLVDRHLATSAHVVEPLLRVDVCFRCGPRRCVERSTLVAGSSVLPVGKQRDGVLGVLRALELVRVRDAGGARRGHFGWLALANHRPAVNVNVVRVEVIRNVG